MTSDEKVNIPHHRLVGVLGFGLLVVAVLGCLLLTPRQLQDHRGTVASENELLIFDGRQAEDILSAGEELLTVEYAHVLDNGEGQLPPHGPYGSIHVKVYHPEQLLRAPWHSDLELHETMLYGPHQTVGELFEWLDDEELAYTDTTFAVRQRSQNR